MQNKIMKYVYSGKKIILITFSLRIGHANFYIY